MKSSQIYECRELLSWYYDRGLTPSASVVEYVRSQNGGLPLWEPEANESKEVWDGQDAPF